MQITSIGGLPDLERRAPVYTTGASRNIYVSSPTRQSVSAVAAAAAASPSRQVQPRSLRVQPQHGIAGERRRERAKSVRERQRAAVDRLLGRRVEPLGGVGARGDRQLEVARARLIDQVLPAGL